MNEKTTRKIVISGCSQCPHKDHKGAFGRVAYIPVCRAAGRELPYKVALGFKNKPVASISGVLPDWCPLQLNETADTQDELDNLYRLVDKLYSGICVQDYDALNALGLMLAVRRAKVRS